MRKSRWITPVLLLATAVVTIISCKTRFATTNADYTVQKSPPEVERGRILVYSICASCHYDYNVHKFIGKRIEDVPGIAGKVYSANLTNSKTNGIPPKYTDAQLKYLLKTGVARDGRFIPYMLRPNMAESDLDAIVAYLRSDDPAVAAADTTVGLTHYNLLGKIYMNMNAKPLPYLTEIKRPRTDEPVALGAYLVDNLGCFHCHSKSLTSLNYLYPSQSKDFMAGGLKLNGIDGAIVTASNITPDKQTGIGNFTKDQFFRAVTDGEAPQRKLQPPMPQFKLLNNKEVDAIYAYIQTINPVYHKVKLY
jgi:mono/diheme cytochrome c family protein